MSLQELTGPSLTYLAILGGLAITVLGTPLARGLASRAGIFDRPEDRKMHQQPIPYLGAAALFVGLLLIAVGTFWYAQVRALPAAPAALIIFGMALGLSSIGMLDDVRGGLSPRVRLAAQVLAAVLLYVIGVKVTVFPLEMLNLAINVVWIVGITNAFNLLDNMDGLCAGVGAVAAFFFALIALSQGQYLVGGLAGLLLGFTLGFLIFNFSPARIFLGDMGSLLVGFLLAVIGLLLRFPESPQALTLMVPPLVLAVAIFDTTLVTITRLVSGVPVSQGGKDHISHRLVNIGLPVRQAVAAVYLTAVSAGALAYLMLSLDRESGWLLMGALTPLALAAGWALQAIRVSREGQQAEPAALLSIAGLGLKVGAKEREGAP